MLLSIPDLGLELTLGTGRLFVVNDSPDRQDRVLVYSAAPLTRATLAGLPILAVEFGFVARRTVPRRRRWWSTTRS